MTAWSAKATDSAVRKAKSKAAKSVMAASCDRELNWLKCQKVVPMFLSLMSFCMSFTYLKEILCYTLCTNHYICCFRAHSLYQSIAYQWNMKSHLLKWKTTHVHLHCWKLLECERWLDQQYPMSGLNLSLSFQIHSKHETCILARLTGKWITKNKDIIIWLLVLHKLMCINYQNMFVYMAQTWEHWSRETGRLSTSQWLQNISHTSAVSWHLSIIELQSFTKGSKSSSWRLEHRIMAIRVGKYLQYVLYAWRYMKLYAIVNILIIIMNFQVLIDSNLCSQKYDSWIFLG